jgi:hypothetical protein
MQVDGLTFEARLYPARPFKPMKESLLPRPFTIDDFAEPFHSTVICRIEDKFLSQQLLEAASK